MIARIEATYTLPSIFPFPLPFPRNDELEVMCISSSSYESEFEAVALSHRFAYLQAREQVRRQVQLFSQR
jgi:hypothetical protein